MTYPATLPKLGCRPPINKPALVLSDFFTGVLPATPAVDYGTYRTSWPWWLNNLKGTCVAATWATIKALVSAILGGKEIVLTDAEIVAIYKTQNPNYPTQDGGMDVQTLLEYLQKRGDIAAFGKIDPAKHDPAISIFGCLVTVVTVRFANVDDYNARRPWDYHPESAVYGYHAVASVGHRDQAADDVRFVTWTREQSFTQAFWAHDVAIWGVILPEHLKSKEFMAGMDLPALADAFQTLTGRVLPIPEVPMEPCVITGAGGGTGTLNLPNPNLRVFRLSDGKDIVPAAKVYQLGPAGNLPNRGSDGVCHLAFEAVGGSFEAIAILDRNMVITPPSAHPISLSIDGKSVYSATV